MATTTQSMTKTSTLTIETVLTYDDVKMLITKTTMTSIATAAPTKRQRPVLRPHGKQYE